MSTLSQAFIFSNESLRSSEEENILTIRICRKVSTLIYMWFTQKAMETILAIGIVNL